MFKDKKVLAGGAVLIAAAFWFYIKPNYMDAKPAPVITQEQIEAVTGFRPAGAAAKLTPKATARRQDNADDLRFFQRLALQLETYSPLFKGRSGRLLRLALETNARAGKPVDVAQLEAAVYLHDIGMMFLPESIWLKVGPLTDAERRVMHEHPSFAAGLAERIHQFRL